MKTIKLFLTLIALLTSQYSAQASDLINFPKSESAMIGVYIKDLRTNKILASQNSYKLFTPASVTKSVTTAGAILSLNPNFRFRTNIYLIGDTSIYNDTIKCNIVVKASGDPTIESRYFSNRMGLTDSIANTINKLGVKHILGEIVIDESNVDVANTSSTWMVEDIAWDYGTQLAAFNYKDNCIDVNILDADQNQLYDLTIDNQISIGDTDSIVAIRGVDSNTLKLSGTVKNNKQNKNKCILFSAPSPQNIFKADLISSLSQLGITISHAINETKKDSRLIHSHLSPKRDQILRSLMVRSDNLFAEGMLNAIKLKGNRTDSLISLIKSKGINVNTITLYDGSGLSRTDRISPIFLGKLYEYMAKSNFSKQYVATFPIVGREGTVKRLLTGTDLAGKLRLKSGSMGGVQCYGGYKIDDNGEPTHAVVIMINHYNCKSAYIRKAIERLLLKIF